MRVLLGWPAAGPGGQYRILVHGLISGPGTSPFHVVVVTCPRDRPLLSLHIVYKACGFGGCLGTFSPSSPRQPVGR